MKRTGPTNIQLQQLISELKKASIEQDVKIWKRIAQDLEKPSRQRRIVNIARINRVTKEGEQVIVPGKVLGTGTLSHKLTLAAFDLSESAKDQIKKSQGKIMTIAELLKQNPKGKNVRIIG